MSHTQSGLDRNSKDSKVVGVLTHDYSERNGAA